jgi:hypothetical protein
MGFKNIIYAKKKKGVVYPWLDFFAHCVQEKAR